jgi:glutamate-1-semialdehyde 2,1-aminomutase
VPAEPGFLEFLRETCTANGSVLIFDEIKTGFRSAIGGYQSICGVTPDLTAFGKAVANGFAVAGIAGRESLMGYLGAYTGERATIDGTYNAAPYAMAAAQGDPGGHAVRGRLRAPVCAWRAGTHRVAAGC